MSDGTLQLIIVGAVILALAIIIVVREGRGK